MNLHSFATQIKSNIAALSNREGFIRHSFTLSLGTTIAQAIPVVFSPILTRIFTPEEFGLLAIISSISAIIGVVATGKFETVIVVADTRKDASNLAVLSLAISLTISLLVTIVLLFFSGAVVGILKQPRLIHWIFVCPISAFFITIYQVYNEWCIRNSQFVKLSVNKIVNSGSITISNLFFGISKITTGGLIFGDLLGRFISAVTCLINALKRDFSSFREVSFLRCKSLAIKFQHCPMFVLPGQLLNMLGGQIPIWMISYYFSGTEVGYYSVASMTLTIPVSMITLAVRDVFKQRANEEFIRKSNCLDLYKKMAKTLIIISILIFSFLFIFLPDIFSIVFGAKWRTAGEFARIFCPMIMINFVSESFSGLFYITKKLKKVLFWQILYLSFTVLFLLIGNKLFSNIKMVLIFLVIGRIQVDLINLYMTYNLAKGNLNVANRRN